MSAASDYASDPSPPPEPHDIELEQSILGAILINNDTYLKAARIIGPDDFYDPVHAAMFAAAGEAITSGRVWDAKTAKRSVEVQKVGDITVGQYLKNIAQEAATTIEIVSYAEELVALAGKRRIAHICEDGHKRALNGSKPLELVSALEDELASVRASLGQRGPSPMARHAQSMLETLANAYRQKTYSGVPWFLPEVDMVMSGPMEAGNLYAFLAASGEGKTACMLQVARYAAEQGHPVLLISYDQSAEQCLRQMDAQALGLVVDDMRKGRLSEEEFDCVVEETQKLVRLSLEIEKLGQGKVSRVISVARSFVKRRKSDKPCLVMIDHIKRITPERTDIDAGTRVNLITSALKGMSEDLGCCTFLNNQRNSAGLKRFSPRPIDEDLFGGAGAKEDYDAILALYRPEIWLRQKLKVAERDSEKEKLEQQIERWSGQAEFSTLKNRFGEPGRTEVVKFVARHTRFVSPQAERQAQAPEML